MEWKEQYGVGIPRFDDDHKILFDLIDQIEQGSANLRSADRIQAVFDVLRDYVATHFRREEDLMAAQKYPGLAAHRARHEALKEGLTELRARYDEDDPTALSDLAPFLNNWLQIHILEQDMNYKAFFEQSLTPEERNRIS